MALISLLTCASLCDCFDSVVRVLTANCCRHEINAPTGFERSVPIQAVQFYTAQVSAITALFIVRY